MTEPSGTPVAAPSAFASAADERSLADSIWSQGPESVPDTLEVRNDSIAVMHNSIAGLRRPALAAVAVAGIVVALIVGAGFMRRLGHEDVTGLE